MLEESELSAFHLLTSNFNPHLIVKEPLDLSSLQLKHLTSKCPAFILNNVLTPSECEALISFAESTGFSKAPVNQGGRDTLNEGLRSCSRFLLDDEKFTSCLWNRISSHVPKALKGAVVVGLNERLRFLRYEKGGVFAPHSDGTYAREGNPLEVSLITLQIYLNEGFEGGETTFLADEDNVDKNARVSVVPKTGMILVFDQDLMHEGSLLRSGVKYTVRTDVMYSYGRS